ncbi:metallophosphoesterase [Cohnella terricola]|uniref:Metallophosphoesterase n=1 Tax=Cohnella terricola TaxID=1289167 RepID=A0A559JQU0_9BACL|nr:metallophosphoesterase [Cohnella terricola]TVY02241.1 metallophosphoesterase [Cohnella terricola]
MKAQPRMVAYIAMLLTVYTGINFYLGWHALEWFDAVGFPYRPWVFWLILGLLAYGYLLGRVKLPQALKPIGRLLKVIGSYYIFVMEAGFILFVLADLVRLFVWLFGGDTVNYASYSGGIVLGLLAILLAVGSRNAWSPVIREYDLNIDKPSVGVKKEWKVAVASDIHLGNVVGRKHLRRLVGRMNAMNPDLILLPGDVIDDSIEPFIRNRMGELLGQLRAAHGVYAVLGNHEYYGGHIERYVAEMNKLGIRVLQDEVAEIDGALYVAGRKDKTAEAAGSNGRIAVGELIRELDHSKPILLMDHQPTKFAEAAEAGADVMLSGHTHRGQFAPNHLFTRRLFELDWGYMRKGAMHVVVSSGFGTWGPPIRIGSRSEIIFIRIKLN